jgi:CBS domain-containing protein
VSDLGTVHACCLRGQTVSALKELLMKIKDLMTPNPVACSPDTNLAAAAALLLDGDCGVLPVVDDQGKLWGIVTDRDLYIALATRNTRASDVTVGGVAGREVFTCGPDDDVQSALATMKEKRVRRLVVEGFGGTVAGIVSMNDILLAAGPRKAIRNDEVVATLQGICSHHHPTPHVTAA